MTTNYNARNADGSEKVTKSSLRSEDVALLEAARAGNWSSFDKVVVAFSGGKDSLALVLWALEHGCPKSKLVLWHHDVDGEAERASFMDWPVTRDYCKVVAGALGLPIRFSWKVGGFLGEMLRDNVATAASAFECEDGTVRTTGGKGPAGTRKKFPAISADLTTRWCSAYLKIDIARRVFANDPAYKAGRFLLLSGERREESGNRSLYAEAEYHASCNRSRSVIQWRAVIDQTEAQVWDAIKAAGVTPHPAYQLGFGRVSCAFCIFGGRDQFATGKDLLPEQFERVAAVEEQLGHTLRKGTTLRQWASEGASAAAGAPEALRAQAGQKRFSLPVLQPSGSWTLPSGAFKACGGPT
jgi:3'-phosphoadenosine 5'-phosphosulfate sulfotransferase (PAPS reductase)/FAD synthetase